MRKAIGSLLALGSLVVMTPIVGHARASGVKPLANVVRCVTHTYTGKVECQKFPEWKARHPEVDHWIKRTISHNGMKIVTMQYPILHRPVFRTAAATILTIQQQCAHAQCYYLHTTYYCLTGWTAGADPPGAHNGIVASYILPWKSRVIDLTTGWVGKVSDHPDGLTQADEWLPCGSAFATGTHVWKVIG